MCFTTEHAKKIKKINKKMSKASSNIEHDNKLTYSLYTYCCLSKKKSKKNRSS